MDEFNKIKFSLVSSILLFGMHVSHAMDIPQDNNQCPTSIQFSLKAREIFAKRMPVVLDKALTLYGKSGNYGEVLSFFAKERREIAQACADEQVMSQEDANRFGKPRQELAKAGIPVSLTTVPYIRVNKPFINLIRSIRIEQSHSEEFQCTQSAQKNIPLAYSKNKCQTMDNYLLGNADDHDSAGYDEYSESEAFQKFIALNENNTMLLSNWESVPHQSQSINDYLSSYALVLSKKIRTLKDEAQLVKVGGFYELGIQNDKREFSYFISGTVILIEHAPLESIPYLQQKAAEHFNAANSWDKQDKTQLLSSIHSFFFYETLAMSYERGTESIAKVGTQFLARIHGYQIHYSHDFEFRIPFRFPRDISWQCFMKNVTITPEIEKL